MSINAEFDYKLYREALSQGETVQLELFLNNTAKDLTPLNIELHDLNNFKKSISPFLKKLDYRYILFFDIPIALQDGLYKIILKNVLFLENNILAEKSFEINITVNNTKPKLSVNPALLFIKKDISNFNIKIKNPEITTAVRLETSNLLEHPYLQPQIIQQNTERIFKFKIKQNRTERDELKIYYGYKFYIIPILLETREIKEEVEKIIPVELLSDIKTINKTIKRDQTISGYISLKNNLNEYLKLNYKFSGDIKDISNVELMNDTLLPNSAVEIKIIINEDKLPLKSEYSGNLEFESKGYKIILPIYVKILDEPATEEEKEEQVVIPKKEEKKEDNLGEIDLNFTVPQPPKPEKPKQTWLVILIVLLLIFAIIYYLSKKKTMKQQTFNEYIKDFEKK